MNREGKETIEFPLQPSTFKGSFEEALLMMSAGDSASFLVSADSLFLKTFKAPQIPKFVEAGSMLTFEVKLVEIKSKQDIQKEQQQKAEEMKVMGELRKSEEPKSIEKYLADNKISVKPTALSVCFREPILEPRQLAYLRFVRF